MDFQVCRPQKTRVLCHLNTFPLALKLLLINYEFTHCIATYLCLIAIPYNTLFMNTLGLLEANNDVLLLTLSEILPSMDGTGGLHY